MQRIEEPAKKQTTKGSKENQRRKFEEIKNREKKRDEEKKDYLLKGIHVCSRKGKEVEGRNVEKRRIPCLENIAKKK